MNDVSALDGLGCRDELPAQVPTEVAPGHRRGTLFVHMGGAKAGSSALQNFLEPNAARLESLGFAYEHRTDREHDYDVSCGNGELLHRILSSDTSTDNEVDSLVLSYFGKCNNAICSSELFTSTGAAHHRLAASSVRLGLDLKVIFYVRDVMPYFLSSYDQVIKEHGKVPLFDEWVKEADWLHGTALKTLADVISEDHLHVLHYDRLNDGLIRSFLDILGVMPSFEVDQKYERSRVNRSLTSEEREILRIANTVLGGVYAKELSNELIYGDPGAQGESASYNQGTTDLLLSRFNSEVAWVNDRFFHGEAHVSVLSARSPSNGSGDKSGVERTASISAEKRAFCWALDKLGSVQRDTEQWIVHALIASIRNDPRGSDPAIPADFEPLSYLLLNPDVLHAGYDPVTHFVDHGKYEGRTYKF